MNDKEAMMSRLKIAKEECLRVAAVIKHHCDSGELAEVIAETHEEKDVPQALEEGKRFFGDQVETLRKAAEMLDTFRNAKENKDA